MKMRSIAAAVTAGLLVLTLAACSDDDGGDEATDDTTTTAAEESGGDETTAPADDEETTEPAEETTEPADDETTEPAEPDSDLASLLVTAEDVDDAFVDQPYEPSSEGGPCGASIDAEYPYDDIAGSVVVDEALGLGLQHELRLYADADAAATAFDFSRTTFDCGETEEGVVIDAPVDSTEQIGADSYIVGVTDPAGTSGGVIVVLVGPVISVYQFQGPADLPDDEGPDTEPIITGNVAELQAAFE